jgi:peptide/nickel transport system permease protein
MREKESYSNQVWLRLKKNKLAMSGLAVILITLFIALFAYQLAPDKSPNANLQTLEIQSKKPGYIQLFLCFKDSSEENKNTLKSLLWGKPDTDMRIPINSYEITGNNIMVERFIDEDTALVQTYSISNNENKTETTAYHIIKKSYLLGTDGFGRDILSRLIVGSRVSMAVGFIGVIISLLIGLILGMLASYYRGKTDAIISWIINVSWSIPTLLLAFAITMLLGKGMFQIFLAIGLTMWVGVARIVRGQVLSIKEQEYVEAARALGFSDIRILLRHILPNITGPLLVIAASNFATAIILEAGLSFLGIGLQPPAPSWGLMIRENYNFIITGNPMPALIPGFAIMLLVLSFNILGNGLRDATDIKN